MKYFRSLILEAANVMHQCCQWCCRWKMHMLCMVVEGLTLLLSWDCNLYFDYLYLSYLLLVQRSQNLMFWYVMCFDLFTTMQRVEWGCMPYLHGASTWQMTNLTFFLLQVSCLDSFKKLMSNTWTLPTSVSVDPYNSHISY